MIKPTPAVMASLHDEVLRMSRLVSDLQELSLVEAGKLPLHCRPIDLKELIEQVSTTFGYEAASKGRNLRTEMPGELPTAHLDPDRIAQVVLNILSNSLRHTPPGGTITIAVNYETQAFHLTINDTGSGIPQEDIPYIFDRFYRAEKDRNRTSGGTGLGLAIAKDFVEAHGGKIWAESTPGKGSTFHILLPNASSSLEE